MSHSYTAVNTGSDTFGAFVTKVNAIINAMATEVMTANGLANGAVTTGNVYLQGSMFTSVLATAKLRGGNVQTSGPLLIDCNVTINTAFLSVGNSTVNCFVNSSYADFIAVDITSANAITANIGVATVNTMTVKTSVLVGNATVNVFANSTQVSVANATTSTLLVPNAFKCGNSTVNVTINATAISFSNGSGTFSLDGSNGVSAAEYNSRFKFANSVLTGTSTQTVDTFVRTDYRFAEYMVAVKDNNANAFQSSKVLVSHDFNSSAAFSTEYGTMASNTILGLFSATGNATHVFLQFTPTTTNCSVSFGRTAINV